MNTVHVQTIDTQTSLTLWDSLSGLNDSEVKFLCDSYRNNPKVHQVIVKNEKSQVSYSWNSVLG